MAAREEDKAMAGLLRRSLAQDAGAGSGAGEDCPQPEILAAYFDHALEAQESARYDLHFSRCAACREQLAAMARAGDAPAAKDAEEINAGGWDWLMGPRWLMPAAAMLLALLVVAGIAWRMRKPALPATEIAMARPEALPSPNSSQPANSVPTPESGPASDMMSRTRNAPALALGPPATSENPTKPPAAPHQRDGAGAPVEPGESNSTRPLGVTSASRVLPRESHAETAARRDALSSVGAASAKPPSGRAPMAQQQAMAQQQSPAIVRGTLRGGSANKAAPEPVTSADATANVTDEVRAPDTTAAPATPPIKKGDAGSVQSDTSAAVPADEAEESTAPKTILPATAAPSRSVTAMNLSASKMTEAAALAKLQEAQISSNLMNLQIHTPDPKIFWMVASPGLIEKSEDGGATWKPEYVETRALILAGAAPTAKICWVVGVSGTILRTTNGAHWKTIHPPLEADFVRVEAADALAATVTTLDGRKFATSDGGKSWSGVK
jgi:Photosynthesis system II assembly factor YCF48